MRLPIKRSHAAQLVSLPDLSGGLNMRDGISEVLDNQITECKNMWWYDGVIRTRKAMRENNRTLVSGEGILCNIKLHNCFRTYGADKVRLCSVETKVDKTEDNEMKYYISFYWWKANGFQGIPAIVIENEADIPESYFVCQHSKNLYCFLSTKKIYKKSAEDNKAWSLVEESNFYTPLVVTSCKKIDAKNATTQQAMSSGVMIEGFNILSDYYKMSFNSYNSDIVTAEKPSHEMRYHIIESVANKKYEGKIVTAEYNGVTHKVTLSGEVKASVEDKVNDKDKLQMRVYRNAVSFWDNVGEEGKIKMIDDGGENDLIITAPYITEDSEKKKVFGMTRTEWFGGGAAGISGGTRLFLCGNKKHSNLVLWSGLDNPLYFPENSYFKVGNDTGAVKGFGKQSDKLVIFKESETWCTEYMQNTNINAENLINGNVVDFVSSSVYFTLTQINPNIGCSYPDTIQLCRNRLVWLGGDNKVYTLVSENAYNERSIYSVSEMVDRKIRAIAKNKDISNATACDWEGYYCLLLSNTLLLMDYNCYGYTHISGYSKTEDANIKIPWFLWELPKGKSICNIGDTLMTSEIEYGQTNARLRSFYFTESDHDILQTLRGEFVEKEIVSLFATKVLDLGMPHIRKNIEQINLQLGNNGGKPIKISLVTENGTEQTKIILIGSETHNYTAGYIESRAVFPCIKQVIKFGLVLESNGTLALDSVILKYRTTGGAR